MIASPDQATIAILTADPTLSALHGGRVSTDLQPGSPSIRVALIGGGEATTEWGWRALLQVECWADDQLDAGGLAAAVRDVWPNHRGTYAGTFVSGTWLESNPVAMPDPQTGQPRYLLTVGLRAHG